MKGEKGIVGRKGEDEACRKLLELGHTILERNWRGGHLEIDIISLNRNGIHFVEVKSRTAPVLAEPEVNVTWTKRERLQRAALAYLNSGDKAKIGESEIFFDIITVVFDGGNVCCEYYPQAFIPQYV